MKVKIIKSSKPTYWYNDKIGEIYEVEKLLIPKMNCYRISDTTRCRPKYINFDDCEVLNLNNENKVLKSKE